MITWVFLYSNQSDPVFHLDWKSYFALYLNEYFYKPRMEILLILVEKLIIYWWNKIEPYNLLHRK